MSDDHIERAAEVLAQVDGRVWEAITSECRAEYARLARALDAAGLLATPGRDAAVAAKALPVEGCSCTPHEQDAGGGHTEYLLEYEPACPEHSEHLWDPKRGMWVLRSERDAAVAAEWADHFEARHAAVGPERLTVESMIAALRGPRPFGCMAGEPDADA